MLRPIVYLLSVLSAAPLMAQSATGSIFGVVTDSSGAVIAGAGVKATNLATNVSRNGNSAEDGSYSLTFLPLGSYRVEVTAANFKKFEQTGIVLEIDRSAKINPVLQLGTVTETVAVNA